MPTRNVREARARSSELVRCAEAGEAQTVTRRAVPCAVELDVATFNDLTGRPSLIDALLAAPRFGMDELPLERAASVALTHDLEGGGRTT